MCGYGRGEQAPLDSGPKGRRRRGGVLGVRGGSSLICLRSLGSWDSLLKVPVLVYSELVQFAGGRGGRYPRGEEGGVGGG